MALSIDQIIKSTMRNTQKIVINVMIFDFLDI